MLPETMTVITVEAPGGPEALITETRALPTYGAKQVLVKVAAAGVNGPDLVQRRGHYPPPKGASDLLGLEVSGTVVARGAEVSDWQVGNTICALTNGGGYAEYVAIEASHCLPIPDGVSLIDAAGLPETYFTVWSNTFFEQTPPAGANLLVQGGAGGIGSTAIQLGKAMGLNVYATAGSDESRAFCMELGATAVIDYRTEDFVEVLRDAGGADIVLDILGGDAIAKHIKCARADGRIISLAFNHGSKVEVNLMPMMLKRLILTGATLRSRPDSFKAAVAADLKARVWPLWSAQELRTVTFTTLPLDQAAKAHEMMETGGHRGKILLTL